MPSDRRRIGENTDAEYDDDAGGKLAADTELITEEDDQRGDEHVGDEGDDEDFVVEDTVEDRAQCAEYCVEGGNNGDRQVRLQPHGNCRMDHDAEYDSDGESERCDHGDSNGWA